MGSVIGKEILWCSGECERDLLLGCAMGSVTWAVHHVLDLDLARMTSVTVVDLREVLRVDLVDLLGRDCGLGSWMQGKLQRSHGLPGLWQQPRALLRQMVQWLVPGCRWGLLRTQHLQCRSGQSQP